jgi:hypothetical protein
VSSSATGTGGNAPSDGGSASANSTAATTNGALAQAQSTTVGSSGQADGHSRQSGEAATATGLRQTDRMKGTESHLPRRAVDHVPEDPGLRVEGANLEIEPVAIAIEARFVRSANCRRSELVAFSSDWISNSEMYESTHNFAPDAVGRQ